MPAGKYDIVIDQGSDFSLLLQINQSGSAQDLTGFTARSQVRPTKTSSTLTATITCVVEDPGTLGQVTLSIANATTAALTPGIYYWDIELVSGAGVVQRLLEGRAEVTAEVTRT